MIATRPLILASLISFADHHTMSFLAIEAAFCGLDKPTRATKTKSPNREDIHATNTTFDACGNRVACSARRRRHAGAGRDQAAL
jgi:hypothetical protein